MKTYDWLLTIGAISSSADTRPAAIPFAISTPSGLAKYNNNIENIKKHNENYYQ